MNKESVLEEFMANATDMEMSVLLDSGLHRHLRFKKSDSQRFNWFEVITWPGSLVINGDFGAWSFSRIEDMFAFFGSSKDLKINEHYWEEKVTACDRITGAARTFDVDAFRQALIESIDGYDIDGRPPDFKDELTAAIDDDVFRYEDEHEIREALNGFRHDGFKFVDTWEIEGKRYTYRYLYCLYSIVWAIQQYDARKQRAA